MLKKINDKTKKIIAAVLVVFIVFYLFYQFILINHSSVKTQTAILHTVEDSIDTTVFIVRDEECLKEKEQNKVYVSLVNDGDRVAENEKIAASFNTNEDADNFSKKQILESELERYKNLISQDSINISDIRTFDEETNLLFESYIKNVRTGDFSLAKNDINDFCEKITCRQTTMNEEVDLKSVISSLESQISEIGNINTKFICSDSTGYFVNETDGFENVIDYDAIKSITTSEIDNAIKSDRIAPNSQAGKIINNFNWYMVCNVKMKDVQDLSAGDTVKVRFNNSASSDESVVVHAINVEDKDNVALVLRCNNVTTKLFSLRKEDVKIIKDELQGYKINKNALRSENGQNGVYVLRGNIVSFRYVDVIYTDKDYVLTRTYEEESQMLIENKEQLEKEALDSESSQADRLKEESDLIINSENSHTSSFSIEKYIRLYDEVIIKGDDLSDGKLI